MARNVSDPWITYRSGHDVRDTIRPVRIARRRVLPRVRERVHDPPMTRTSSGNGMSRQGGRAVSGYVTSFTASLWTTSGILWSCDTVRRQVLRIAQAVGLEPQLRLVQRAIGPRETRRTMRDDEALRRPACADACGRCELRRRRRQCRPSSATHGSVCPGWAPYRIRAASQPCR